ncbi:hypothetical protein [Algisphaera agarilytica]|uniref:Uncharacterized protein n=1 Tax=Algisphaera agarilytica TaxID=1385975 RepID=A0A7X0HBP7_9BACT|nr:hypothetical protein [Algisphaera agarilytica]MBB6431484.1 hypothetical protein [Algisphaera agarilytica]
MKTRYKLAIAAFMVTIGFIAACAWLIDFSGRKQFNEAYAQIEALGGVVDFSTYGEPRVPNEENAALLWVEAAELLEKIDEASPVATAENSESTEEVDPYGFGGYGDNYGDWGDTQPEVLAIEDPFTADPEVLAAAIAARQKVLDIALQASTLTKCQWELDYDAKNMILVLLPHLGQCRAVARLLIADAYFAAKSDDWKRADENLTVALRLAEHAGEPPFLINVLVRQSIDLLVIQAIKAIGLPQASQLESTLSILETRQYREQISRGILGESPLYAHSVFTGPEMEDFSSGMPEERWTRLWRNQDRAFLLRGLVQASQLAKQPYYEVAGKFESLEDVEIPMVFTIANHFMYSFSSPVRNAATVEEQRDLLFWALRIHSSADHSSIESEPPIGVLTGKPMKRWHPEEGGFVVWSVSAESPEESVSRENLVLRVNTSELPPELEPYADDLNSEE